jgi:hypothetical protein
VGEDGELRATDVADRLLHHIHRPARRRPRLVPIPGGMVASPSATPPPPPPSRPLSCSAMADQDQLPCKWRGSKGEEENQT